MLVKYSLLISIFLFITLSLSAQSKEKDELYMRGYKAQEVQIKTRWTQKINPTKPLDVYPRPIMKRKEWKNLNGFWEYAITDTTIKRPTIFDGLILVPYPIESALSGVKRTLFPNQNLWYRKTIIQSHIKKNERTLLHFGAIDWEATVFVNNHEIGNHSGGYQSFSFDITPYLKKDSNEILIKVYDPTDQGINPHGKQVLNPTNIYYTPSSGIWQTVWLESVPNSYITKVKSTPDIDNKLVVIEVSTNNRDNLSMEIALYSNNKTISFKKIENINKTSSDLTTKFTIAIPNARLWSPDDPFLYDLSIKLLRGNTVIDNINSYIGMRKIDIQKDAKGADRIFLNNKYLYNLGTLDQGFWPDGLYTAPTDEALSFDIKAIKSMGFNTIRKHIKVEPERWYYLTDSIGILVWQDFVNPPQYPSYSAKENFEKEVRETIDQLYNHPSIISWILFNERWGSYDQKRLTEWLKSYDPSRIINGHSGELLYVNNELRAPSDSPWISSDVTDVHSYPDPRNPPSQPGKAKVIGEFGGIGVPVAEHQWDDLNGWGYVQVTPKEFKERYTQMIQQLVNLEKNGVSASIYTQPFDVEGEENGLITYDREIIKIPVSELRQINSTLLPQQKKTLFLDNVYLADNISLDDDSLYIAFLSQFKNGRKDSSFLRRLTLMALKKDDQHNTTLVGNKYFETRQDLFRIENIRFFNATLKTTQDKAFELFNKYPDNINKVLGSAIAEYKVKSIINKENIAPFLDQKNKNRNWDSLENNICIKYGDLGDELISGIRMINYREKGDWANFGKYYVKYFKKALNHPEYDINNITWSVFEHIQDTNILSYAIEVMNFSIRTWDNSAEAFDTYANLLHKLKMPIEAIQWEEKALKLKKGAPDEKIYAETLQKMKSGLPTWPQNN